MLKNVVVFDRDLSPEGIVRRAFRNVKRNYYTKPFVYQTFYRHYCKDDSVYGRLIEAAAEVYKRKGYKVQQPFPGWKEEVRVNQLRRSYDNTKVASGHVPIALYSIMAADPVGYQVKSSSNSVLSMFRQHDVSNIRTNLKGYAFTLDGITEYDGEQVYIIHYRWKRDSTLLTTGIPWRKVAGTRSVKYPSALVLVPIVEPKIPTEAYGTASFVTASVTRPSIIMEVAGCASTLTQNIQSKRGRHWRMRLLIWL